MQFRDHDLAQRFDRLDQDELTVFMAFLEQVQDDETEEKTSYGAKSTGPKAD